ncbi:stage III sporulation protein AG [Virgibacillus halotolerans]|uniref:stage III sporulation protein AG n=1 Tax=Virgibacillus halotolerans TaxID=1071053 RepID=UPI0019620424|nr:stage III sporulation protein AG [Virgibacillus halotolerans]MBM7597997.1 stage III sporulation protein AG [Virgibacillus halotolerans]
MKKKPEELFNSEKVKEKLKNPSKKTRYIIVLALAGLLLLIISNVFSTSKNETDTDADYQLDSQNQQPAQKSVSEEETATSDVNELEKSYEKDLVEMLNKIKGVSEVEVMVNLDSTNVKVYEKNLVKGQQTTDESDRNGGTRKVEDNTEDSQAVLVRQGEKEVPLLIQTEKPDVRGVFVVAKGVDHATVKKWMIESVSRVLDVPTHKISVMPKN